MNLRLLDLNMMLGVLQGVVMELEDCNYDLLNDIAMTDQAEEAFAECDVAVLVGAMPRKEGMERKDLLRANAGIFKVQGAALNKVAKKTVKVLVVGNPANTNALILSHYAPSLPSTAFTALTRLDANRAHGLLGRKLGMPIHNAIIWGNHSNTQYPDVSHCEAAGRKVDVQKEIDETWYREHFVKAIQTRGAAVIAARKLSSALSAAKAIADHLTAWLNGTTMGEYCSMAVASQGDYGIPTGLFYSFPVTCKDGQWKVVTGLKMDEYSQKMMKRTADELIEERDEALQFLGA